MEIQFQLFPIHPLLKGLIEKIWYFEAPGKLPGDDMKLVVPNGRPLLILTCKNTLLGNMNNRQYVNGENRFSLVGICDTPSIIDSQDDGRTASIGIEFNPIGFYRFFKMPASEFKNDLNLFSAISGKEVVDLENEIAAIVLPDKKVARIQLYLLSKVSSKADDPLFNYCIEQIEKSKGSISVKRLEKITGYSSRWLNLKFKEQLGISPKNFSSVIRFQHYYQAIIGITHRHKFSRLRHDLYYDQSHFIKDFKRFTGMTPSQVHEMENKFGQLFY